MKAVRVVSGTGVPLKRSDVDTDQIIPAEWLKRVERTGFEKGLFSTWRDDRNFVLNQEQYQGASILVAGPAFGAFVAAEARRWPRPLAVMLTGDRIRGTHPPLSLVTSRLLVARAVPVLGILPPFPPDAAERSATGDPLTPRLRRTWPGPILVATAPP